MNKKAPEICYSDEGNGQVIVFLHGFLESNEIWNEYAEKLSENYRVISIDLPGHGNSSLIDKVHSMELMATEVRNILEISGINKCILVGHSMGGYVSVEFAAKYPQFLKGLILLNSHAGADTDEEKTNRNRVIEIVKQNHIEFITSFYLGLFAPGNAELYPDEIEKLKETGKKMSADAVVAALAGMRDRHDHVKTLEEIKIPAMLISGEKDPRINPVRVVGQLKNAPQIRHEIIKNSGHLGFIESRDEVFVLIGNFAQQVYKKKK